MVAHSQLQIFSKRAVDILISALGLALLALVYPVIAFLINRDSNGPVLFPNTLSHGRSGST
jgi:lipopolysaccharide/colanic/teichoic acid biosynthesis glycosyltransferase